MHTYEAKVMWFLLFITFCIITGVFVNAFTAVLFTLERRILTCCDDDLIKSRSLQLNYWLNLERDLSKGYRRPAAARICIIIWTGRTEACRTWFDVDNILININFGELLKLKIVIPCFISLQFLCITNRGAVLWMTLTSAAASSSRLKLGVTFNLCAGRGMITTAPHPQPWELCAFTSLKCRSEEAARMDSVALYWNQRGRDTETVGGMGILFKQALWVADSLQKPLIDYYWREALTQSRAW